MQRVELIPLIHSAVFDKQRCIASNRKGVISGANGRLVIMSASSLELGISTYAIDQRLGDIR